MKNTQKIELTTPDLGDSEKIELVSWNFKEGDKILEGDEILELVTDKAAFPVESPANGTLEEIRVKNGIVKKGQILGVMVLE